jgi:hypothetical protein
MKKKIQVTITLDYPDGDPTARPDSIAVTANGKPIKFTEHSDGEIRFDLREGTEWVLSVSLIDF